MQRSYAAHDEEMEGKCALCGIADGSISAPVFWEDTEHVAFLSGEPNTLGFSVVIPKQHHPSYLFDVPERVMLGLVQASREVARILDDYFDDVGRTALIVEGMGVDHLHAKLFPMHGTGGLSERWEPVLSRPEDRRYFDRYEGFVASNLGPHRADREALFGLASALRARAGIPGVSDERVRIVAYDKSWPEKFALERDALAAALGEIVNGGIHHVGSTAVPGLAAKPIIDILVGVTDLDASRVALPIVEKLGYCYAPYRANEMHWFCKPHPAHRTHHLHLVPVGSPRYRAELAFRDFLRAEPERATAYAALKQTLAERFATDREAYTAAKEPFIRDCLAAAGHEPN